MIKHLGRKQSLAAPETVIDPSTWWLKMMDIQSNQSGYSGMVLSMIWSNSGY